MIVRSHAIKHLYNYQLLPDYNVPHLSIDKLQVRYEDRDQLQVRYEDRDQLLNTVKLAPLTKADDSTYILL